MKTQGTQGRDARILTEKELHSDDALIMPRITSSRCRIEKTFYHVGILNLLNYSRIKTET